MATNPGFQVSIDVKGRPCLVLGGDDEAAEKAQRLLEAGAKVTVIHPTLNDTLRRLTASGKIIHRVRTFRAPDAEGAMLVHLRERKAADETKLQAELPEFVRRLRVYRQNEAFNQWLRKQIEQARVLPPQKETPTPGQPGPGMPQPQQPPPQQPS